MMTQLTQRLNQLWPLFHGTKASRTREALRMDCFYGSHSSSRRIDFRLQGCHYVVLKTPQDEYTVLVNGRLSQNPPKAVLKMARRAFVLEDVEAVHSS